MIDQLFGSKTRVKLLHLFYNNPNRPFYVREITRKIDEQINSVRRELSNLLSVGLITSVSKDNRLYYEVNQTYEHYESLSKIFTGLGAHVNVAKDASATQKEFRGLGKIQLAYLMGHFVQDDQIGLDVLLVGDLNKTKVAKLVKDLETQEGTALNYSVMSAHEFEYRRDLKDRFISNILQAKKAVIIDEYASAKKAKES